MYKEIGLVVGRAYSRQKIRIALCKIYPTDYIQKKMIELQSSGHIELTNQNGLHNNYDFLTIKKDFLK